MRAREREKKRRTGQSKYDAAKATAEASRAEASSTLASFEAAAETDRLRLLESEKNVEDCKIIHQEKERALRAINTKQYKNLEKFRLQATRAKDQKAKNHTKDWSKVRVRAHLDLSSGWVLDFCSFSLPFFFCAVPFPFLPSSLSSLPPFLLSCRSFFTPRHTPPSLFEL
jgi:hypothetical protein